jgi:hypothetical protein
MVMSMGTLDVFAIVEIVPACRNLFSRRPLGLVYLAGQWVEFLIATIKANLNSINWELRISPSLS